MYSAATATRQSLVRGSPRVLDQGRLMTTLKGNGTIGIVKEVYNKWERRAPLCPSHVEKLTREHGIRVLVQPSARRVFTDAEYAAAGAEITDDLSPASVVFGVKQVPVEALLPDRTYVFFSHVIKAQPENMELLDTVLERNVRLIDYECITEAGNRSGPRLIAFGSYAGRAGMIDGLRGLGERMLALGYSTPFLNVGSTYMYPDLVAAKDAVSEVGAAIARGGALPADFAPLTFTFTGNGNVSRGAQEIFELLPHEYVKPEDLPHLEPNQSKVYGVVAEEEHMARLRDGSAMTSRQHYYQHPEEYEGIFHDRIAPYTSMLVNCTYWDHRYPRLLTTAQAAEMRAQQTAEGAVHPKLLAVADISCDIGGSVEFLTKSTYIEDPFFMFDPATEQSHADLDGDGVLMCGVDILPSELPRESSNHFGELLLDMVKPLALSDGTLPFDQQNDLPKPLHGACIASHGALTPNFEYISKMRVERDREAAQSHAQKMYEVSGSTVLRLRGHLFDTNLINQVLDLLEADGASFFVVELDVRPYHDTDSPDQAPMSSADIQISVDGGREALEVVLQKIGTLIDVTPKAEASMDELPWEYCSGNFEATLHHDQVAKTTKDPPALSFLATSEADTVSSGAASDQVQVRDPEGIQDVVVLGAGLVAKPAVEYLARRQGRTVTVVSSLAGEAKGLRQSLGNPPNVVCETLDANVHQDDIMRLVDQADAVVSLLPATMHVPIARGAIASGTKAITASYVSDEMRELDAEARAAGVPVLCEMGLDPGMDHMSAMKVIDEVKADGGRITSFSSLCGGLPAPEAANNPLMYKFSWSPAGVLSAAQNSALYRENAQTVSVDGVDLLASARPTNVFNTLALEHLPNRDSLPYGEIYGISDAESIYRGTLRYAGWSKLMHGFRGANLFSKDDRQLPTTWAALSEELGLASITSNDDDLRGCLEWLGCFSDEPVDPTATNVQDAFCTLLQRRLAFGAGERDMAIMAHEFGVEYSDGRPSQRLKSTFIGYGEPGGDTIMAKTVGLTVAVGAELVLGGAAAGGGVLVPTIPELYNPGLSMLEKEGLCFTEETM